MKRKITAIILIVCMLAGCVACASSEVSSQTESEPVALLDPVNAISNVEVCTWHNLYTATVYFTYISPEIYEYSFSNSTRLQTFGAFPGEQIQAGAVLAASDKTELRKSIEALEEEIEQFEQNHEDYVLDMEAELTEPRREVKWLKELLAGFDDYSENKEFYGAEYQIKEAALRKQETAYAQQNKLYELDRAYYQQRLDGLNRRLAESDVYSGISGTVVATSNAETLAEGESVAAVGDMSTKILTCKYVGPNTIDNAKEVYALIDGQKYELKYRPLSASEYNELSAKDNAYSTFEFVQETPELSIGDYAAIVIVSDGRDQVLAVPKEAIHKNESGNFVYVMQDGQSVITPVKTGFSDGVYTEILEGPSQGDIILLPDSPRYGDKRGTITKGTYVKQFDRSGFFIYPDTSVVKNTHEYGEMYFGEYQVSLYDYVNQGDVIATVRVQGDEIELDRLRTRQNRLNARMADLEKKKNTYKLKVEIRQYEKQLIQMQREIAEIQEEIDEKMADYGVTQILADTSGIIVGLEYYDVEDLLEENAALAEIAVPANCYIMLDNSDQLLNLGTRMTIDYEDEEGNLREAIGTIANFSSLGISSELRDSFSLVLLEPEDVERIVAADSGLSGGAGRKQYSASAELEKMEQVLLVPRDAVIRNGGNTYVNVIGEDGNVTPTSFIAGGYNNEYYWVISGLTEGMEVCWE